MLHAIVLIFGFTGILGKLISLDAERLVFWRVLLGGGLVAIWLRATQKFKAFTGRDRAQVVVVGCIAAIHWVTFFASIKVSNVSVALATLATAPLFVSLVEPVVHKRRLDWREMMLGIVILCGLFILLIGPSAHDFVVDSPSYYTGIVLALVSAFLAAVFSTLNSVLIQKYDSANLTRLQLLSAAALLLIYFLAQGKGWERDFWEIPKPDWLWMALLATFATAFAYLMSIEVMKKLTPFTTAVAINMEPVYTIVLAALIFGEEERMSRWFYLGTAIIVGAVFVDAWLKRRTRRQKALIDTEESSRNGINQ